MREMTKEAGAKAGRDRRPPSRPETTSWWTARATAEVTPGFTRDAILAETPPDPAAAGGLFERVGQVLSQLAEYVTAS